MMSKKSDEMSFLQHLEVLRWHLVRSSIAILLFAVICFMGKSILFDVIIFGPREPNFITYKLFCQASRALGIGEVFCLTEMPFDILNTKMAGQFSTHIWVSLIAGFILAFPYVLYEVWRFIKPGLKETERKYSRGVIFFASILFAAGVLFGYYLITPLSVQFLGTYSISAEVTNIMSLNSFITTVSTITLSSGLIFELPIVVYFLAKIGLLTPEWMRKYRRHAFVATLILSAIITPPDISSQVLVSLPIVFLYELSIKICARVVKNQKKEEDKLAVN
jgi:sec-independent protein translocase protein TatC